MVWPRTRHRFCASCLVWLPLSQLDEANRKAQVEAERLAKAKADAEKAKADAEK